MLDFLFISTIFCVYSIFEYGLCNFLFRIEARTAPERKRALAALSCCSSEGIELPQRQRSGRLGISGRLGQKRTTAARETTPGRVELRSSTSTQNAKAAAAGSDGSTATEVVMPSSESGSRAAPVVVPAVVLNELSPDFEQGFQASGTAHQTSSGAVALELYDKAYEEVAQVAGRAGRLFLNSKAQLRFRDEHVDIFSRYAYPVVYAIAIGILNAQMGV